MSFTVRKALSFSEGLVDYVLERYRIEKFKPIKPDFKLNRRIRTSGSVVEGCRSMFQLNVGLAVVSLQPQFEEMLEPVEQALNERNTDVFDPTKFLEFCCLATLEMAHQFFENANFTIPDYTTLCISKLLVRYYREGTFNPKSDWERLSATANSILMFERRIKDTTEFMPKSPPPYPEPESVPTPQSLPPIMPGLEQQSVFVPSGPTIPVSQQSVFYPQYLAPTTPAPQQGIFYPQCVPSIMPCTETELVPSQYQQAYLDPL